MRAPQPGTELPKDIFDLSSDWYWEQDERYRFTKIKGGAFAKAGFRAEEYLGTTPWDRGGCPVGDAGSWDSHKAVLKARRPFADFLFKRPNSHGALRYISSSGHPAYDAAGRFRGYRGIARDVTERLQTELRLTIEHGVTHILAESDSIADAAPRIIRLICETLGWACGSRWALDATNHTARCLETWGTAAPNVNEFLRATAALKLPKNPGGLVRQLRAKGEAIWLRDVTEEASFLRGPYAAKAGLRSAFAFPITAGTQVIGAMEFFSQEIHQPDAELLDATRYIGSQIGQFIKRKQAEEALRENEKLFHKTFEYAPVGILHVDVDGRILRTNRRMIEILGYEQSELVGRSIRDFAAPEDREVTSEIVALRERLYAGQIPSITKERRFLRKDGSRAWVALTISVLRDAAGNALYDNTTVEDISERKRAEQLLKLEHTVNRCLAEAESTSEGVRASIRAICETEGWECGRYFRVDEQAAVLRFADAWGPPDPLIQRWIAASEGLTYTKGQGISGRAWETGDPIWVYDRKQRAGLSQKIFGETRDCFMFPLTADGKTVGVFNFINREVRTPDARLLQAVRVIGGQIGQFVQRKQAEDVLRESEARFRSLTELSSDWYWQQDENLRFTQFSGGSLGQTGIDTASLAGKTLWEVAGLEIDPPARAAAEAKIERREAFHELEYKQRLSDGTYRFISLSGAALFDTRGRFAGYRGIGKDVTGRRREEQLLTLEHAVTRCLSEQHRVSDALTSIMRAVCETQDWDGGLYFQADEKAGVLRCSEYWGVPDRKIQRYLAGTPRVVSPGAGLAGLTWKSGEPVWISDISADARAARAALARETGVHGSFLFPAISEGRPIGVLCFVCREVRQPNERLLRTVRVIGDQIGQFVQRKHAEEIVRENEARFRSLTELSADWYWEQDARLCFVQFSGQSLGQTGIDTSSLIGKTLWDIPTLTVDAAARAPVEAKLQAREPFYDLEYTQTRPDGIGFISVSGTPLFDAAGLFAGYRGVGKDVTARKREEQLLALEHAVNRCLAEAESAREGVHASIRAVCETEGWECGRYFRVDKKADVLRFHDAWGIPDPLIERYIEASRELIYPKGKGIHGRVWQTGEPIWVSDRGQHAGLSHAIFGSTRDTFIFPLLADGKVVGVLSFTNRELRAPDTRLLQAVRVIGSQIGQFVQRKQAEQATLRLGRMFAALSATNDAILHAKSPEELYQQVCDAAVHGGKFSNISILLAEPGATRTKAMASAGSVPQQLRASHISVDAAIPEGQGLVGVAFRTQRPCVSNDFLNDERTRPWHEMGRKANCRSAAALPLTQGGRSVGAVLIHDHEVNAFDDEIVTLLERLAENISFALDNFEREAERRRAEERVQYLATHDGLTDLPNRVMFSQMLNLAIQSGRRYDRRFAVLFLDLDRFKIINDTLGHEAGDLLLQEMAKRLKDNLRSSDVVARLGGDEFVVLLQEVGEAEQVATVARKLLSTVIKPVVILGQECRVTASMGISMYPTDAQDEQTLMKNADMAMYLAKEEGKNNFQFYSKDIKAQSLERLTLEMSLRHALEREEFFLNYQAKLDLVSGTISGVEALLRWQHPELGLISPVQFIPLAEETGLIVPIGKWVLRTACAQNVAWQQAGLPPVCMAINLSPRQFADENLLSDIAAVLEETGMAPELLELEITESMVMGNVDRAAKQLAAIKQMGVRLAIDDFGTGYSSLAQIKRFPIDTIKVDRSFIREIPQDAEDKAITQAIIAMGKSLSLTVVAEGVETEEQQKFLRQNACNEMQGYYFSKPIAAEQFAELLRTHIPGLAPQT